MADAESDAVPLPEGVLAALLEPDEEVAVGDELADPVAVPEPEAEEEAVGVYAVHTKSKLASRLVHVPTSAARGLANKDVAHVLSVNEFRRMPPAPLSYATKKPFVADSGAGCCAHRVASAASVKKASSGEAGAPLPHVACVACTLAVMTSPTPGKGAVTREAPNKTRTNA